MSQIVVIHGPQGCGKTRNAQALAAHFGCSRIIDDWDGASPLPEGALALTSATDINLPQRAMVLAFGVAMNDLSKATEMSAPALTTSDFSSLSSADSQALWLLFRQWCRRLEQPSDQVRPADSRSAAQALGAGD